LCKVDPLLLKPRFKELVDLLLTHLEVPEMSKFDEMEKLSACNNACWTVGLLSLFYAKEIKPYVELILKKLLKIISLPRLNKSLAQNVSICIGRLALVDPEIIACLLDEFLKQFCLSLRYINDSAEKREAFSGLCKAILHNPTGVMNYFAFFCDAICQYDNSPEELENLFQTLISSYRNTLKERWQDYFKTFPEKLKHKMTARFKLNA